MISNYNWRLFPTVEGYYTITLLTF